MAIDTLERPQFAPTFAEAGLPLVGAQEAFEFTYGGRIPTYAELMALGSYVAEFTVEQSSVDPNRPPVYRRQDRGITETMTADIFAPYQTVATPDYWALSSTERDGLGAILRLKTYRDLPSRRDLEPQDSDEATLILLEAQSEAQARLDLDSAIRETERAARLEEVWATSRHAVRIGATTIGSTELAQLRQRSLRERMTAVNTRPLPEYTDTPAADTEVAAPGRLRTIATAIGRSVSRLWHKQPTPAGRHRA